MSQLKVVQTTVVFRRGSVFPRFSLNALVRVSGVKIEEVVSLVAMNPETAEAEELDTLDYKRAVDAIERKLRGEEEL